MAMALSGPDESSYSDINMTPLIDVMLVLLIIFIITIPVMTHAVKIDTPLPVPNLQSIPPEVIDVRIDFDGLLTWNSAVVDRPTLRGYIQRYAAKTPQPEIHIAVDKFAKYEVVAQTLADLQSRGLRKIAISGE
jgi:biopolymer transport protein ExbD